MTTKLSKKAQINILQQLRYGKGWHMVKQSLLPYEYTPIDPRTHQYKNKQIIQYNISCLIPKIKVQKQQVQQKINNALKQLKNNETFQQNKRVMLQDQRLDYFYDIQDRYFGNIKSQDNNDRLYFICKQHSDPPQACYLKTIDLADSNNRQQNIQQNKYCKKCNQMHVKSSGQSCAFFKTGQQYFKIKFIPQFNEKQKLYCIKCRKFINSI